MTVGDLIKNKDYDRINWRMVVPEHMRDRFGGESHIFVGIAASKGGRLISLDGDSYSRDAEVVMHREWNKPLEGIFNGLTVVTENDW